MMNKQVRQLCIATVLLWATAHAYVLPQVQYDEARIFVTLPLSIGTSDKTLLHMAKHTAAALWDKQVVLSLKGYVRATATLREQAHILYSVQRLQRILHASVPGVEMSTVALEMLPECELLPAWRMSTARTIPSGYVAVIVQPLV